MKSIIRNRILATLTMSLGLFVPPAQAVQAAPPAAPRAPAANSSIWAR